MATGASITRPTRWNWNELSLPQTCCQCLRLWLLAHTQQTLAHTHTQCPPDARVTQPDDRVTHSSGLTNVFLFYGHLQAELAKRRKRRPVSVLPDSAWLLGWSSECKVKGQQCSVGRCLKTVAGQTANQGNRLQSCLHELSRWWEMSFWGIKMNGWLCLNRKYFI